MFVEDLLRLLLTLGRKDRHATHQSTDYVENSPGTNYGSSCAEYERQDCMADIDQHRT